ncbi:MAG: NHL repeat-containing protein [Candidatus Electryonea clarkiae]|nr:NHL repeat-containing protein [Candidatus Electryonea clarkiae]MDP8287713.1 NHL repeat-containing protein [Candidatus Electryonea clarkiae]
MMIDISKIFRYILTYLLIPLTLLSLSAFTGCSSIYHFTPPNEPDKLKPLLVFGQRGKTQERFQLIDAIVIDKDSYIYVGDQSGMIHKISPGGRFLSKIGRKGRGDGEFADEVKGIAIDSEERLIAVDKYNFRVQVFDLDGNFIFNFGSHGAEPGHFLGPEGIAVDSAGRIYVTDHIKLTVQIFDRNGAFIKEFGGKPDRFFSMRKMHHIDKAVMGLQDGRFYGIESIAWYDGMLYVAEEDHGRIQVFTDEGDFLGIIGNQGVGKGYFHDEVEGIVINSEGFIFAVDEGKEATGVIEIFDPRGRSVYHFKSDLPLESPDGIALDEKLGRIYVTDQNNYRVQAFDLNEIRSKIQHGSELQKKREKFE